LKEIPDEPVAEENYPTRRELNSIIMSAQRTPENEEICNEMHKSKACFPPKITRISKAKAHYTDK
jgi:hypothetical protein